MPELPEVETTMSALQPFVEKKIVSVDINNRNLRWKIEEDFEKNISNLLDVEHSLAVSNATSALHLACLALDLKDGDSVWTSPTTFVASANCAQLAEATKVVGEVHTESPSFKSNARHAK